MKIILRNYLFILIGGAFLLLQIACEPRGEIEGFTDIDADAFLIDTLQIETYTYLPDSVPTSNTNQILVGRRRDQDLGLIEVRSFFHVGPDFNMLPVVPDEDAKFVSLILHLNYNYFQGDTTQAQTIFVHELSQELEFPEDEDAFYNTSQIRFFPEPIGQYTFNPKPNEGETLEIPLLDSIGRVWLDSLKEDAEMFSNAEDFIDVFEGIALVPHQEDDFCILGFESALLTVGSLEELEEVLPTLFIELTYEEDGEEFTFRLPLVSPEEQFNQVQLDSRGTLLENVNPDSLISSETTNETSFLLGGVGLVTKIVFPSIDALAELGRTAGVQYAELVIEPVRGTYPAETALPLSLELFITNDDNELLAPLVGLDGNIVRPVLRIDNEFQRNTTYTFDITRYVISIIDTDEFQDNALLLVLPENNLFSTVDRVVFGTKVGDGTEANIQLRVIATRFF